MNNKSQQTLIYLINQIWKSLTKRRKVHFLLVLILTIFTSFSELLSIGALIPFLTALTDPNLIFSRASLKPIFLFLDINSPEEILLPLAISFGLAAIFAGGMRLLQTWVNLRAVYAAGADLSEKVYRHTLYQPYSFHVSRNSSSIINTAYNKTDSAVGNCILPLVNILTSGVILISIMSALILIDPFVAFSALIAFGSVYLVIVKIIRKRLRNNSKIIARETDRVVKTLQEGLGGIRDVLIDGSQEVYCKIYNQAIRSTSSAQSVNGFISASPRFVIEAIGMVLISVLAFLLVNRAEGSNSVIPILGTLAFGAQRMLPAVQQIYFSWSSLIGSYASLKDVVELLQQSLPDLANEKVEPLSFKKSIDLENIDFKYKEGLPNVLNKINLNIPKGTKLGIIGTTGSGKSTLLDIIMGLLSPTCGVLKVDGNKIDKKTMRAWQKNIAHVPQFIYLSDTTVEENIAFGVPEDKIDHDLIKEVALRAQISETIESMPDRYKTIVGERGIRLSGGQRQRIGIARALYKNAGIIIFDEATSSLDNKTEYQVMEQISKVYDKITIVIIAHRLSTLNGCDSIIEIEDGKIVRIGKYSEILEIKKIV